MTTEVDPAYLALIASDRVSARTRTALQNRAASDDPAYRPKVLTQAELATLRAVLARVLPQHGAPIDLAARLDAAMAAGEGDGWRYADLPTDPVACSTGLAALDRLSQSDQLPQSDRLSSGLAFAEQGAERQDAVLAQVAAGEAAAGEGWTAQQMQRWFEDLRSQAVRLYVAHPATLARIGYSGIGYGGDGEDKPGFQQLEPGEPEPWEPEPWQPAETGAA